MTKEEIITKLKSQANPANVAGMARFGIASEGTLGVSMPDLRHFAKEIGKEHSLALELWETGIHEARILAGLIDIPAEVTQTQMKNWVKDFDSWDVCDQVISNLFIKTPWAYEKALEWSKREFEFEKRAGFVMMAMLAVHDKKAPDDTLAEFFPELVRGSDDNRNFVKKAVNWALRQLGKRNGALHKQALETAEHIAKLPYPAAKWIASDAMRELKAKTF